MIPLAFDLETIPLPAYAEAPDVVVEATGTVPACHPTTARIVAAGLGWRTKKGPQADSRTWADMDRVGSDHEAELALVTRTVAELRTFLAEGFTLVTFNGKQFDLPMLRMRAALLGVPTPGVAWSRLLYPYDVKDHCDLRLVLGNGDRRAKGSQAWYAGAFGVPALEHGADVFGWVQADRWDDVRAYNAADVETLLHLFTRVEGVL